MRYNRGMSLLYYLAIVNAVTFLLYWQDKRAARRRQARAPEFLLLLAGFLGGTPAAVFAQQWLRHKNRKASFQVKFWLLVMAQLGLMLYPPAALKWAFARLAA